jgi:hypothetical protein
MDLKQYVNQIGKIVAALRDSIRVRRGMWTVIAAFIVLQAYFVRELLAAELLFGLAFAILLALGAVAYALGTIGERGLDWTESGVRFVAANARRGYLVVEEFSGRAFRRTRSQQAQ